jgi:hypothetical protein
VDTIAFKGALGNGVVPALFKIAKQCTDFNVHQRRTMIDVAGELVELGVRFGCVEDDEDEQAELQAASRAALSTSPSSAVAAPVEVTSVLAR